MDANVMLAQIIGTTPERVAIMRSAPDYTETFPCKCGDEEFFLHTDEQDPSTWAECGLRISQMRQRILDAR